MAKQKVIMTTNSASKKFGLTPEYYRKLIRQGKLSFWGNNPQYFWKEDLIKALDNERDSNKTEILKW